MTYAKAIAAFFTSLGTWGATALADGRMDPAEWFGVCGVIVATAAVWGVTNTPAEPARKTRKRRDAGQSLIHVLLVVILVLVILKLLL